MNWDLVKELLVTDPCKKICVSFKPVHKTKVKSFSLFSTWVNEKVWELVTYCTGALLGWVYTLN